MLDWFKLATDNRQMSTDLRLANDRERRVLAPIKGAISYLFGRNDGTLKSLQNGAVRLSRGEQILCDSCIRSIWQEGHHPTCELAAKYFKVLNGVDTEELKSNL